MKTMPITLEEAQETLRKRRWRLARFIELNAPEFLIVAERRLIRAAIYAVETGELPLNILNTEEGFNE